MTTHKILSFSEYQPIQLMKLVLDIESYPEFLPWCAEAKILDKWQQELTADLTIGYKSVRQTYTSIVNFVNNDNGSCEIEVSAIKGPFKSLRNYWRFTPKNKGTEIYFELDFQLKSIFFQNLIGAFFDKAASKMVTCFEQRAHFLYKSNVPRETLL